MKLGSKIIARKKNKTNFLVFKKKNTTDAFLIIFCINVCFKIKTY